MFFAFTVCDFFRDREKARGLFGPFSFCYKCVILLRGGLLRLNFGFCFYGFKQQCDGRSEKAGDTGSDKRCCPCRNFTTFCGAFEVSSEIRSDDTADAIGGEYPAVVGAYGFVAEEVGGGSREEGEVSAEIKADYSCAEV